MLVTGKKGPRVVLARLSALPWVDSPGNKKIAQIHSPSSSSSSSRLWLLDLLGISRESFGDGPI